MLELLAPAGSRQALQAAVQNGADAVYLGAGAFNARMGARNFSMEELAEAVTYCHIRGVKVYLTVNTLVTDREMEQAAELLRQLPGNVLLTTGSKELHSFAVPGLVERCCPRVLPMAESLERCLSLGFLPKNIICMQGPFTKEMNAATLRQYHIATLVTKDTGGYGGFREKAEAAREMGCALLVVERPMQEEGMTLQEIQARLCGAQRKGILWRTADEGRTSP